MLGSIVQSKTKEACCLWGQTSAAMWWWKTSAQACTCF